MTNPDLLRGIPPMKITHYQYNAFLLEADLALLGQHHCSPVLIGCPEAAPDELTPGDRVLLTTQPTATAAA